MADSRMTTVVVTRVNGGATHDEDDVLAIEEPLEIGVEWEHDGEKRHKKISVTMRTPGDDEDLAVGFLFTEGLIRAGSEVDTVRHWGSPNIVRVRLRNGATLDTARLDRHFYTTSSCGVCGKSSIDAVRVVTTPLVQSTAVSRDVIHRLPIAFHEQQSVFRATGGLHGAAVFDRSGTLMKVREDVGRHNAVDKVIGSFVRKGSTLSDALLVVSSRAGFEIVQKAIMAGIPLLAAVGAPSSLAVDLANEFGLTLLGFVREGRFNVYSGRIA